MSPARAAPPRAARVAVAAWAWPQPWPCRRRRAELLRTGKERETPEAASRAAGVERYRLANVVLPEEFDGMARANEAGTTGPGYRGAMPENVRFTLAATTLSSPDPGRLADFYARLLGWPVRNASETWAELAAPTGGGLSFHGERDHVAPVWPAARGRQQMQSHLDIEVDDLERGVAHAVSLGATVADFQPQEDVRVCLDPDGHPFCLFVRT